MGGGYRGARPFASPLYSKYPRLKSCIGSFYLITFKSIPTYQPSTFTTYLKEWTFLKFNIYFSFRQNVHTFKFNIFENFENIFYRFPLFAQVKEPELFIFSDKILLPNCQTVTPLKRSNGQTIKSNILNIFKTSFNAKAPTFRSSNLTKVQTILNISRLEKCSASEL